MPIRRTMKRGETPGHGRYLTFSCYRRLPLFANDRIKDAFAERIAMVKADMDFVLHAWVIMPTHVHLLIRPHPPRLTGAAILNRLKTHFAQQVIRRWR